MEKQEKQGAINNVYKDTLFNHDCTLKPHIHRVTLSHIITDLTYMHEKLLERGFKRTKYRDKDFNKSNTDRSSVFNVFSEYRHLSSDQKISLSYNSRTYEDEIKTRYYILMHVHDTNEHIHRILIDLFNDIHITPKVSIIEFAWDVYCDHVHDLQDEITEHLCLSYNHGESRIDRNTYYSNDLRSSAKGIRCYLRPKEGKKDFVRLELQLNRPAIRRLGIQFPLYKREFEGIDFLRFLKFQNLEYEKLKKRWVKRSRSKDDIKKSTVYGALVERALDSKTCALSTEYYEDYMYEKDYLSVSRLIWNFKKSNMSNYRDYFSQCEHENNVIRKSTNFGFDKFSRKTEESLRY